MNKGHVFGFCLALIFTQTSYGMEAALQSVKALFQGKKEATEQEIAEQEIIDESNAYIEEVMKEKKAAEEYAKELSLIVAKKYEKGISNKEYDDAIRNCPCIDEFFSMDKALTAKRDDRTEGFARRLKQVKDEDLHVEYLASNGAVLEDYIDYLAKLRHLCMKNPACTIPCSELFSNGMEDLSRISNNPRTILHLQPSALRSFLVKSLNQWLAKKAKPSLDE